MRRNDNKKTVFFKTEDNNWNKKTQGVPLEIGTGEETVKIESTDIYNI